MVWEPLAKAFIQYTAPHMLKLVKTLGKPAVDKFVATCTNVFSHHLEASVANCANIKNVLYREEGVPLRSQYVACAMSSDLRVFPDSDIVAQIKSYGARYLVSGYAGSGKSMVMKWITLELAESLIYHQRVPLFLEVRDLSTTSFSEPFEKVLFENTANDLSTATYDQFLFGLKASVFVVILDGLDEVPPNSRRAFFTALGDFGRKFPNASVVCSSRPDNQVESQVDLSVLRMMRRDLDQICAIIDKSRFDDVKKARFIEELRTGLFEANENLLSTPLIALIWLITYDHDPRIRKKLTLFYNQVFEALFFRHDSSKGVFSREHHAGLAIDQLDSVLQGVGFKTYAEGAVRFSYTDAVRSFREVLTALSLPQVNPEHVLQDSLQSVNLLYEDGGLVGFIHRSFQEYFAAKFVAAYQGPRYYAVVTRLAERTGVDNVIYFIKELDRHRFVSEWLMGELSKTIGSLERTVKSPAKFSKLLNGFEIRLNAYTSRVSDLILTDDYTATSNILLLTLEEDEESVSVFFGDYTFAGVTGPLLNGLRKKAEQTGFETDKNSWQMRREGDDFVISDRQFSDPRLVKFFDIEGLLIHLVTSLKSRLRELESEVAKNSGLFESAFSDMLLRS